MAKKKDNTTIAIVIIGAIFLLSQSKNNRPSNNYPTVPAQPANLNTPEGIQWAQFALQAVLQLGQRVEDMFKPGGLFYQSGNTSQQQEIINILTANGANPALFPIP